MNTKYTLCFIILLLTITFRLYAQDDIKNYREPEVSEGSNLFISANPTYANDKYTYDNDTISYFNIRVDANASYLKWKFTPKFNYAFNVSMDSRFIMNNDQGYLLSDVRDNNTQISTDFNTRLTGGVSYYLIKNKLYIGTYLDTRNSFSHSAKPYASLSLFPNIGYGKIVNAFIVSETSNFENILIKEKYLNGKLSNSDKTTLNAILDKRNNSQYTTKYKDSSDIEFFTELETLLLNKGIISKPLNARTTMELYQSLTNQNYVYLPRFKGFQVQAELQQSFIKGREYNQSESILNFSSVYGLPLSMKFGLAGSVFLAFPLTSYENINLYDFSFHSPLVIQDQQQLKKFSDNLIPEVLRLNYTESYSYVSGLVLSAYYYINNSAGIKTSGEIIYGRNSKHVTDYAVDINSTLLYNIIAKLDIYLSVGFRKDLFSLHSYSVNSGISYYIF